MIDTSFYSHLASFRTVLNKIMEYSGNVVVNLKKMIEFLRFPVIFLL
ncbi:hypothetical protein BOVA115_3185 [Bacteroides ovatus]|nr:hypothetical protein BOVA115_3185 [Bacteroides ovatus]